MKANLEAFERLKGLEGNWRGRSADGAKEIDLRYVIASKRSVVIEFYQHFFKGQMSDEMVTVYHPSGEDLMLTHYCTLGNQPRMIADLGADYLRHLSFKYVSATNLTHHDCLRMSGVSFRFDDDDHFEQTWYWFGKKCYVDARHHSDDYDDLPDDGRPGQDTFLMIRKSAST